MLLIGELNKTFWVSKMFFRVFERKKAYIWSKIQINSNIVKYYYNLK